MCCSFLHGHICILIQVSSHYCPPDLARGNETFSMLNSTEYEIYLVRMPTILTSGYVFGLLYDGLIIQSTLNFLHTNSIYIVSVLKLDNIFHVIF